MRARNIGIILLFAVIHFGLMVLAIYNGFVIFRGPSTPSEIFWDRAMQVLLFPGSLLIRIVSDKLGQSVLMVLNSLLWGAIFGSIYVKLRKSR
ncbi:MAG TPA: hypothetical protein VNZ64_16810 [Candidatus Acidoferrum sp.]|jgi:hypothetical protein|nr:hypothetical protein [Candidatus Acidoferrum sp.]